MKADELKRLYEEKKAEIRRKLLEFEKNQRASGKKLFYELVFCLLTPQSNAEICNALAKKMEKENVLFRFNGLALERILGEELRKSGVRFWRTKARNLLRAKETFMRNGKLRIKDYLNSSKNAFELREKLVKDVRGIGMKEASHFIRNIGFDFKNQLAILDRHILKSLQELKVIKDVPKSLNKRKYLEIERKLKIFARKLGLSAYELDLLLWYSKTGKILR